MPIVIKHFTVVTYLYEEVNCTEPSPPVSVPLAPATLDNVGRGVTFFCLSTNALAYLHKTVNFVNRFTAQDPVKTVTPKWFSNSPNSFYRWLVLSFPRTIWAFHTDRQTDGQTDSFVILMSQKFKMNIAKAVVSRLFLDLLIWIRIRLSVLWWQTDTNVARFSF